jgi:hypothetical protein
MTKKFLALATCDIENERIKIKDELVDLYIDPVYEQGYDFSGEVMLVGCIHDDADESTTSAILQDYLREHFEGAKMVKVQFDVAQEKKNYGVYRKAG